MNKLADLLGLEHHVMIDAKVSVLRELGLADDTLVVITGDFVCHSQLYLDQLTEVMSAFVRATKPAA